MCPRPSKIPPKPTCFDVLLKVYADEAEGPFVPNVIPGFNTISVLSTIVCPSNGIFPVQEIPARFPATPRAEPLSVVPSSFILFINAMKSGISLISRMLLSALYQFGSAV